MVMGGHGSYRASSVTTAPLSEVLEFFEVRRLDEAFLGSADEVRSRLTPKLLPHLRASDTQSNQFIRSRV